MSLSNTQVPTINEALGTGPVGFIRRARGLPMVDSLETSRREFLDSLRDFALQREIADMVAERIEQAPDHANNPRHLMGFAYNVATTLVQFNRETVKETDADAILDRGGMCLQYALVANAAFHQLAIHGKLHGDACIASCRASETLRDGTTGNSLHAVNIFRFQSTGDPNLYDEWVMDTGASVFVPLEDWVDGKGYESNPFNMKIEKIYGSTPNEVF